MARHYLDRRTDRLARKLMGYPVPRDTFYWASLRADIAATDLRRAIEFGLSPMFRRLGRAMTASRDAFDDFAEALTRR